MLSQIPMWIMWGIQIDFLHFWDELKRCLEKLFADSNRDHVR
jgi:hypothetical protein